MNLLIILAATLFGAAAPVSVRMADNSTLEGQLIAINGGRVSLQVDGERLDLPQAQIKSIEPQSSNTAVDASASTDEPKPQIVLGLRGGSELLCDSITSDGKTLSVKLLGGAEMQIAPENAAWCLLQAVTPAIQPQWQSILELQATADQLILKRSDEAIDKIAGVIKSIDAEKVIFEFDGQTVPAPRAKLLGFTFFSKQNAQPPAPSSVVTDRFGTVFNAIDLAFDSTPSSSESLVITISNRLKLEVEINNIQKIDYSAGNIKHLIDMKSLATDWQGIGYPGDAALAKQLLGFQPHRDSRAASYDLECRGSASATYRVPSPFTKFQAVVYAAGSGNVAGDMWIQVRQETDVLFREKLEVDSKPLVIDVPVQTGKRITISSEPVESRSFGGITIWQQARFAR